MTIAYCLSQNNFHGGGGYVLPVKVVYTGDIRPGHDSFGAKEIPLIKIFDRSFALCFIVKIQP